MTVTSTKYIPIQFTTIGFMNYMQNLSNLTDNIAQKYYEYNNGNFQLNTIYDIFSIGTSILDIRADINPKSNVNLSFVTMLNFRIQQDTDILFTDLQTAYSNNYLPVSDPAINNLILTCNVGAYSWMSSNNLSQSNSNAIYYYFLQSAISSNTITTSNIYYIFADKIQEVRDSLLEMSNLGFQGPDISGQLLRIYLEPTNNILSSIYINSNIIAGSENDIQSSNYKIQSNVYKIAAISTSPNAASSFVKTMAGFLDVPESQDPGNVNIQPIIKYTYDTLPILNINSNSIIGKILGVSSYNRVGWQEYSWELSGDYIENISDSRVMNAYVAQSAVDSTGVPIKDWQFNYTVDSEDNKFFNNGIHVTHLRGVISNANKEVYCIGDSYKYTYAQAATICAQYGGVLASTAELRNSQLAGASWCAAGWVSDDSNAKYPTSSIIPSSIIPGCGTNGINVWTPPNGLACVVCYGIKPRAGTANIRPFNDIENRWNQPQNVISISVAWTEQEWDYGKNSPWLGGPNNDTLSIANRAAVFNYYPDYSVWGRPDWLWDISGDISHPDSKTDLFTFSSDASLGFNSTNLYSTRVELPIVRINESFLDTDGGRCPQIYCSDQKTLNSLVDQYNTGLRPFTKIEDGLFSLTGFPTPTLIDASGEKYAAAYPGKIMRVNRVFTTGPSICDIDADMAFGIGVPTRANNNGQFTLVYPNYAQSNMKLQLSIGIDEGECSYSLSDVSNSYAFINNTPITLAVSSNISSNEVLAPLSNPYYYAPGVLSNFQSNIINIWSDATSFNVTWYPITLSIPSYSDLLSFLL